MAYKILSLDGGGVRGILTATLLKRLDQNRKIKGWLTKADMIAGTSTGGILAMGLGQGKRPTDIVRFYETDSIKIFRSTLVHEIKDLGGLLGAKYDNVVLLNALKHLYGDQTRLRDLKPTIVIPSFDLDAPWMYPDGTGKSIPVETWKPKIFHNDTTDPNGNDRDELVYSVAMRTSAAPTYFPSFGRYIDGGVVANNPSMVALAQALVSVTDGKRSRGLNDIVLLSLGTGVRESRIGGGDHDWGGPEWLSAGIIELLLDSPMDLARYQCKQLLGARFWRLSPYLESNIPLDDARPAQLRNLKRIANDIDLTATVQWIEHHWQ